MCVSLGFNTNAFCKRDNTILMVTHSTHQCLPLQLSQTYGPRARMKLRCLLEQEKMLSVGDMGRRRRKKKKDHRNRKEKLKKQVSDYVEDPCYLYSAVNSSANQTYSFRALKFRKISSCKNGLLFFWINQCLIRIQHIQQCLCFGFFFYYIVKQIFAFLN